jgi:predicted amidohydrolase YtcJ
LNDDSGHNGWVNSAALKIAALDANSKNPEGGTIVRGADGEPNGVLLETAARIFDAVIPTWSDEQLVAAAKESSRLANIYGITSIKDPRAITLGSLWPEQAVSLKEALQIYTINGARALRLEKQTGSIKRGKSADIIVLSRNLFHIPVDEISDTQVARTYFEGKLVYAAKP